MHQIRDRIYYTSSNNIIRRRLESGAQCSLYLAKTINVKYMFCVILSSLTYTLYKQFRKIQYCF